MEVVNRAINFQYDDAKSFAEDLEIAIDKLKGSKNEALSETVDRKKDSSKVGNDDKQPKKNTQKEEEHNIKLGEKTTESDNDKDVPQCKSKKDFMSKLKNDSPFEKGMKLFKGLGKRPNYEAAYKLFYNDRVKDIGSNVMYVLMKAEGLGTDKDINSAKIEARVMSSNMTNQEFNARSRSNGDLLWAIGRLCQLNVESDLFESNCGPGYYYDESARRRSCLGQYARYTFDKRQSGAIDDLKLSADQGYEPAIRLLYSE